MKVCLVKMSSMGDVLHTLPALTDAQNALPGIQFDWVVEENFTEIPAWHSAVQQVIPVAIRRWRKNICSSTTRKEWKAYLASLRMTHYDAVIDAQGLLKSAILATRLIKGIKYGYHRQCVREPLASLFYNQAFYINYQQHAVERIRQLFAQSLNYTLPQTVGNYNLSPYFLPSYSALHPYIIFIHATTREDKHWLDIEWKKMANKLTALGYKIHLPWNNIKEKQRAEWIAQGQENVIVLPKLNLTALASQITHSQAVISVDTGLAHLAAALDKPNITLYGSTMPELIGTYGKNQFYLKRDRMDFIRATDVLDLIKTNCLL